MKSLGTAFVSALAVGISTMAGAQQPPGQQSIDLGKWEYDSKCASCHGLQGKGDGPNAPYLNRSATNLTTLAKNNNGVFPVTRMYEVIDGTQQVAGHGTRDMPVWGRELRVQAAEHYVDVQYNPYVYARVRILAIIEYVSQLQTK